jgi:hypothetical protein
MEAKRFFKSIGKACGTTVAGGVLAFAGLMTTGVGIGHTPAAQDPEYG